jgi:hypothetical protein
MIILTLISNDVVLQIKVWKNWDMPIVDVYT